MSKKVNTGNRRKLLKSVAATGGAIVAGKSIPQSWSKPVVDAVMLPAHAETTDETISDPTTTVAPTTSATPTPPPCCLTARTYCEYLPDLAFIEIDVQENGTVTVTVFIDGSAQGTDTIPCDGGQFSVTVSLHGSQHTIDGDVTCGAQSIAGTYSLWDGQNTGTYTAGFGNCDAA